MIKYEQPVVPCKYCGDLTSMTGTRQCNRCWEIASRLRSLPENAFQRMERLYRDPRTRSDL